MVPAGGHADQELRLLRRSSSRIEEAGEPSAHGLACRVLGGYVQRAIDPRTTDGTERGEDSLVHGDLEPLRRKGFVEDPLHPIDVESLGCGDEGMRHRIRWGRRWVDRPIGGRPSPRRRLAGERRQIDAGRPNTVCRLARAPALVFHKGTHRGEALDGGLVIQAVAGLGPLG